MRAGQGQKKRGADRHDVILGDAVQGHTGASHGTTVGPASDKAVPSYLPLGPRVGSDDVETNVSTAGCSFLHKALEGDQGL